MNETFSQFVLALLLLSITGYCVWSLMRTVVRDWKYWSDIAQQHQAYLESHPSIDDREFLRLCGPNADPKIALKVRSIIAEQLSLPEEIIYPDASWHDLAAD